MRLLRTYILKEHLSPFLVTLGGLTAVLLIGNVIKFAELVIAKGVSPFDLVRLLLYLIPYMLSFTVPMACLISMVLAFGRLSADFELIAMRASGVAPMRLVFPVLVAGCLLSTALFAINNRLVPSSHLAFRRQLKAIGIKQPTAYLEAGTFIKDFPPYTIFVYDIDKRQMHNVRIYEPQPKGPTRTIIADRGEFERLPSKQGVRLVLHDGTIDEWDPQTPGSFYKVSFQTYTMTLRSDQDDPERMGKKLKDMNFRELVAQSQQLRAQQIDPLPVNLELHGRIAASFAPLVFVMFGLLFGLQLHHQERLMTYIWVLAIFVIYYLGTIGMNVIALKGWLPAWLAMWMPNLVGWTLSGTLVAQAVRH